MSFRTLTLQLLPNAFARGIYEAIDDFTAICYGEYFKLWKLLETHIHMKRGRLFFEWRGLYPVLPEKHCGDKKSGEGPPPVLPLKGALSIPFLPKSTYCSHAQRGFLQGLAASWPFASGRPGWRGGGWRAKKKKLPGGGHKFFSFFLFLLDPTPQPQGPVALCLLSP